MSRHDTHLTPLGNDTWAVSANHSALALALQGVENSDLVSLGDTLGDCHDEFDFIFNSLDDSIGCTGGWDVDDRCVWLGFSYGVTDRTEHWQAEVGLACFLVD
jgi:hypothetical protein